MTATSKIANNGKATTIRKTFTRETSVAISIQADPSIIWKLLTIASDFPRWNSTILSIEGSIAPGKKIKLRAAMAPKRVFKLSIREMVPEQRLSWGDAMGTRIFTISKNGNSSDFNMSEKIGGPLFPLFAKHIPSFDAPFEQFAADLKREVESIQHLKK